MSLLLQVNVGAEVRDVAAVAELAAARARPDGSRGAVGEHRVLRPDAGVDDADDDVLACVSEPPSDGQTSVAPMNSVLSSLRLLAASPLHRRDARDAQELRDPVRRNAGRHAAVGEAERRAEANARHCALHRLAYARHLAGRVAAVARDRPPVLREGLAGDARARRLEAANAPAVRRHRVEVVLDHHVHELRAREAEQRPIGLRGVAGERLRSVERRRRSERSVQPQTAGARCSRSRAGRRHGQQPDQGRDRDEDGDASPQRKRPLLTHQNGFSSPR